MDEDPPPEAAVVEKKRGRPKGSTRSLKCRTCSKNGLPCGASCPNVDGGPSADAAASEGAASSRPATASGDHLQHDVQTPLHGGPVLVPPSLGADEATPADGPGLSAAHGSASTADYEGGSTSTASGLDVGLSPVGLLHVSTLLGSGADDGTPGVAGPAAAQDGPSTAESAEPTVREAGVREAGKRDRRQRDLHAEDPEYAQLRDKSAPKLTKRGGLFEDGDEEEKGDVARPIAASLRDAAPNP